MTRLIFELLLSAHQATADASRPSFKMQRVRVRKAPVRLIIFISIVPVTKYPFARPLGREFQRYARSRG